ncbi:MAG TPA: ATP synthase F1 subunit delta [Terriglobales bacterium]
MASVTNTYARALADVLMDTKADAAKALQEAQGLSQLVAGNKTLREVWEAPSITAEQKRAVLDAIVKEEGISRPVRNFIAVLIDHRRINFLAPIVKQLEVELNQRLGFVEADIRSARELTEQERRGLESDLNGLTGKKIRAKYSRDTLVLGGAVVQIGSTIYDGSVKGQLERLRAELAGA